MRVAIVVASLDAGGTERFSTLLAQGLHSLGHDVTIITLSGAERAFYQVPTDVKWIAVSNERTFRTGVAATRERMRWLRRFRLALKHVEADVVVSLGSSTNVVTLLLSRFLRVPIVISERSDPRGNPITFGWRVGRRLTYPVARHLVVQTESVAQVMQGWVRRGRTAVIPNPVLPLAFEIRWTPEVPPTVVAMGRMSHEKGFDVLIEAFVSVHEACPTARLQLIGDGPLRASLADLVASRGLAQVVEFNGRLRDPHTFISQARCFVLPSRLEGFPNALLEAMAIGVPCVATDCLSGPRELLGTEAGLLVPVDDPRALAREIKRVLSDPVLSRSLSRSARRTAENYTLENIGNRWESLLQNGKGQTDC